MKLRLKSVVAGAAALALAGTGLALTASPASAYSGTPPWVGVADDVTHVKGALIFYDAAGNVLTGGTNISAIGSYVGVTTAGRLNASKAALSLAAPSSSNALPSTWTLQSVQGSTTFSPTPVGTPATVSANGNPFLALNATGADILTATTAVILDSSTPAYANVVELRVQDSGVGVPADAVGKYWRTDIEFNPAAIGGASYDGLAPQAWRVVYPAAVGTATTTTVTATPVSGAVNNEQNIFFTANTSANGGGTVQFKVDGVAFGATKTVAASASGTVATSDTGLVGAGSHSITAVFTPAAAPVNQAGYAASTGTLAPYVVNQLTHPTSTALSIGSATVAQPAAATGSAVTTTTDTLVAPSTGSVSFFLDGGATAFSTSSTAPYTFSLSTSGLTVGNHSVVAVYTDGASFGSSTSAAGTFNVTVAQYAADAQYISTSIAPGTLVISTPYTVAAPLVLPAMSLNSSASLYSTSAPFLGIQVTDTRPGNLPYTLSALSSNLTKVGVLLPNANETINAQNVGLNTLALTTANATPSTFADNSTPGTQNLTGYDNVAASGVLAAAPGSLGLGGASPHSVLHANSGLGSTVIHGLLTINAPTNTIDGTYNGTVTFTVIGS